MAGMSAEDALALAKSYVKKTLSGGGAIQGKDGTSVSIQSVTEIGGGHRVTFLYYNEDGEQRTETLDVMDGKDGADGISPTVGINSGEDGTVTLTITDASGTNITPNLKGEKGEAGPQGIPGARGEQGVPGVQGQQGIQGVPGERGADGYPFLIYKEYTQIDEFNDDDFPEIGLMFMVKNDDEPDGYPVYRYTGEDSGDVHYSLVTHLGKSEGIKGEKGEPGEPGAQGVPGRDGLDGKDGTTYTPVIGDVTKGDNPSATVVTDDEQKTATFSFVLPKGDKGEDGQNGTDGIDGQPGVDGKDGKDGRSITKIEMGENNSVLATFSDNKTENIGKLDVNVEADFLTDSGFGKLRYYQGKFQYFDGDSWIDTSVSPQNPIIMQMMPQEMQYICCVYDKSINRYKLKWIEPKDTVLEGQNAVSVEKVVIRRKQYEDPIGISDGYEVTTIPRSSFGSYANEWYIDFEFEPNSDEVWYYKAFPVSTSGFINTSELNSAGGVKAKDYALYGFKIGQIESDPTHMITYLPDCDNANFRSAHMDYNLGVFDYGDWTVDGGAWFMGVKPCLLAKNGTVTKYLDQNDYTKDEKGNDVTAEIEGTTDNGYNVMIEVPKVYWKIVDNKDNTANIYFSDKKLNYTDGVITEVADDKKDGNFVCWSHIDENGAEIPYCYMPAYNGSDVSSTLRTLSNKAPISSQKAETEIAYAKKNNEEGSNIWYTEVYCDRVLIDLLLLLIGKSTDTQTVFGAGHNTGGTSPNSFTKTGGMNNKGLFWGTKESNTQGVKVFGMEHYWGNEWRKIAGWINDNGKQKVKMTYGTSDDSTEIGYNTTGVGYIEILHSEPTGVNGSYISKKLFTEYGMIPTQANGSATTDYVDGLWFNNGQVSYVSVGGDCNNRLLGGAFCSDLSSVASREWWSYGASISCKPLASTWEEE